jgi:hypothetical protein
MSDLLAIRRIVKKLNDNEKNDEKKNEKKNDYQNYRKRLKTDLEEKTENNLKYSNPFKISIIDEKMNTEAITTVEYKHVTFVIVPPKGSTGDPGVGVGTGTGDPEVRVGAGTGDPEVRVGAGTGDPEVRVGTGTGDPGVRVGTDQKRIANGENLGNGTGRKYDINNGINTHNDNGIAMDIDDNLDIYNPDTRIPDIHYPDIRNPNISNRDTSQSQCSQFLYSCPSVYSYPNKNMYIPSQTQYSQKNIDIDDVNIDVGLGSEGLGGIGGQGLRGQGPVEGKSSLHDNDYDLDNNIDYIVISAYDEALTKIFSNITALDVAVSVVKNGEDSSVYDYSYACKRLIKSLKQSCELKEEYLFLFRINSIVDENDIFCGERSILSLEGIDKV